MSTTTPERLGTETYARIRDYAVNEPSFTVAFAAWELGLSVSTVHFATNQLLTDGVIREIEPRRGPWAAVYQYAPPPTTKSARRLKLAELDAGLASEAPARGEVVPLTGRADGPSGKPGVDRHKQERGRRVKRARQGT